LFVEFEFKLIQVISRNNFLSFNSSQQKTNNTQIECK